MDETEKRRADLAYHLRRAAQERRRAEATDDGSRLLHTQLAELHEQQAARLG